MDRELIVIIEDEEAIAEFVRLNLERAGFRVAWAVSGEDGLGLVRREPPVLVVLDLRLPGMDGLEVCRHLRQFYPEVAVIMLTARGQPLDKVRGLELGADDYITKPFDPRELVARVQAVLRRTRPRSTAQGRVKQFGNLHIDLRRRRVSKEDRILLKNEFISSISHELRTPFNFHQGLCSHPAGRTAGGRTGTAARAGNNQPRDRPPDRPGGGVA